mgnify:FL=1
MQSQDTTEHLLGHGSCPACQRDNALHIEEITRLRAQNRDLLAALETAQWGTIHGRVCPQCGNNGTPGHSPSCQIGALIAAAKGEGA